MRKKTGKQMEGTGTSSRRMLTLEQVLEIVPVSRSTLLRMEAEKRFPKGVFISDNRKVWYDDLVKEWQGGLPNGRPPRKPRKKKPH